MIGWGEDSNRIKLTKYPHTIALTKIACHAVFVMAVSTLSMTYDLIGSECNVPVVELNSAPTSNAPARFPINEVMTAVTYLRTGRFRCSAVIASHIGYPVNSSPPVKYTMIRPVLKRAPSMKWLSPSLDAFRPGQLPAIAIDVRPAIPTCRPPAKFFTSARDHGSSRWCRPSW